MKTKSQYYFKEKIFPEGPKQAPAQESELYWDVSPFVPGEIRMGTSYILDFGSSYIQYDFCYN